MSLVEAVLLRPSSAAESSHGCLIGSMPLVGMCASGTSQSHTVCSPSAGSVVQAQGSGTPGKRYQGTPVDATKKTWTRRLGRQPGDKTHFPAELKPPVCVLEQTTQAPVKIAC